MRLSTVFDHGDVMGAGKVADRWHVSGPTAQMDHDNGLGVGSYKWRDGVGCNRSGIRIDIGKNWLSAKQYSTGSSGDESTRCGDQLITRAEAYSKVSSGKSQRSISHGYGLT